MGCTPQTLAWARHHVALIFQAVKQFVHLIISYGLKGLKKNIWFCDCNARDGWQRAERSSWLPGFRCKLCFRLFKCFSFCVLCISTLPASCHYGNMKCQKRKITPVVSLAQLEALSARNVRQARVLTRLPAQFCGPKGSGRLSKLWTRTHASGRLSELSSQTVWDLPIASWDQMQTHIVLAGMEGELACLFMHT